MDQYQDRPPPADIEAEMCVLGAAMISADALVTVVESLREDDFLRPAHKRVFRAIQILSSMGQPADAVTVRLQLQKMRAEGHVPDGSYLLEMTNHVPTAANAGYYVKAVLSMAALRRLTEAGPSITSLGYETPAEDAEQAVESAKKLFDEATKVATKSKSRSIADLIIPFMDSLESKEDRRCVSTGLADLDNLLAGGFRPGQLITIGARPGVGKSVVMAGFAHHVGLKLGKPVFISTLEMSTDEYMARLVSLDGGVELTRLLRPKLLTEGDFTKIGETYERMVDTSHVVINDDPTLGISGIRSELRDMRRADAMPALVIVDYLQLMEVKGGRSENRQTEVSGFSRSLKLLAKEFEVPIAIGSQLNREVEKRQNRRPAISDLRESGSIEQDSDVVILLDRPDLYEPETPRAGEIDIIAAKNRNGPRATVVAAFQGHYSRVMDMAKEQSSWPTMRSVS